MKMNARKHCSGQQPDGGQADIRRFVVHFVRHSFLRFKWIQLTGLVIWLAGNLFLLNQFLGAWFGVRCTAPSAPEEKEGKQQRRGTGQTTSKGCEPSIKDNS
jgi:hypothetical protein